MWKGVVPVSGFSLPLVRFGVFRVGAVRRLSFCGVLLMSSFSLSPLSSVSFGSSSVVVSRLGWDSSSRSILLWLRGSAVPLVCRTDGAAPDSVAGLVALLRKSRDTGLRLVLGVREGWDGSRWFCAATDIPSPSESLASRARDLRGRLDVVEDWEYYGHSSPDTYVEGEGCGVVGCCV